MRAFWGLLLFEGIALIALGVFAIIVPVLAALTVTIILGWVLLIGGLVGLITTIAARHAPGFWWSLLSAVVALLAGLMLLRWPVGGTFSVTVLLGAFFAVEGVASIMYAIEHKRELSRRWGWMFTNGVFDLILAAVLLLAWPVAAAWVLGLLVGIDMVFGGTALVAMALAARTSAS
jgi:uncharacterized membrane protein HdeD (DUF308 family)